MIDARFLAGRRDEMRAARRVLDWPRHLVFATVQARLDFLRRRIDDALLKASRVMPKDEK